MHLNYWRGSNTVFIVFKGSVGVSDHLTNVTMAREAVHRADGGTTNDPEVKVHTDTYAYVSIVPYTYGIG